MAHRLVISKTSETYGLYVSLYILHYKLLQSYTVVRGFGELTRGLSKLHPRRRMAATFAVPKIDLFMNAKRSLHVITLSPYKVAIGCDVQCTSTDVINTWEQTIVVVSSCFACCIYTCMWFVLRFYSLVCIKVMVTIGTARNRVHSICALNLLCMRFLYLRPILFNHLYSWKITFGNLTSHWNKVSIESQLGHIQLHSFAPCATLTLLSSSQSFPGACRTRYTHA